MPSDVITASGHQDVDIRGGAFQANARLERAWGSDGRGQVRAGGGHSRSGHRAGSGDEAEPRRSATGFRRAETRVCWARGSQARAGRSRPAAEPVDAEGGGPVRPDPSLARPTSVRLHAQPAAPGWPRARWLTPEGLPDGLPAGGGLCHGLSQASEWRSVSRGAGMWETRPFKVIS